MKRRASALEALYQRIKGVPGDIVELGVASGASIRVWVKLAQADGRRVFGFDTFAGFPELSAEDGPEMPAIGKKEGGDAELRDRPLRIDEVNAVGAYLVQGDIAHTLPWSLGTLITSPVALVFFDADLYEPTESGLRLLWPVLSPGGLFVFDEYGHEAWPGETKAVDDFLTLHAELELERLDYPRYPYGPSALIQKASVPGAA